MARPTAAHQKRRVQVRGPDTNAPQLDVVAPMDVRTPASDAASGWASLQNALGVAAPMIAENDRQKKQQAEEQGMADQRLNKVDQERLAKQKKYADGVTKAHVITQTQAAIAAVEERASKELDADIPVNEKIAWIDAQLKGELGPLADDAESRRIIHTQYQDYLEKFAGREIQINRQQNQDAILSAWEVETTRAIEGGEVDLSSLVNEGASHFAGGRTEAWQRMVDLVASHAEAENDDTVLSDLLPAKVTTEDGQSIDSPILSKVNKARIELAKERIKKFKDEKEKPMLEWTDAEVLRTYEDRILATEPIALAELEPYVKAGRMSAEKANSLVTQAANAIAQRDKKAEDFTKKFATFQLAGGESWVDTEALPDGAKNRAEAQELTDMSIQRLITGYAQQNGVAQPPITGQALKENPALLDSVLKSGQKWRLPYTPLKSYLAEINPAMGRTVLDRLEVYEQAKKHGVETMYVDEDTHAIMELALTAKRAGEKDEQIINTIQRLADPAVRQFQSEKREKTHKLVMQGDFDVANAWLDEDTKELGNLTYVQSKLKNSADFYLSRGLSEQRAAELARQRFADTHFTVKLGGKTLVVPESPQWDSSQVSTALEAFDKGASVYAKKAGDPNPAAATMTVTFGRNGRDVEVFYVGSDGLELNAKPLSIPALIEGARKLKGSGYDAAVKASRDAQAQRRMRFRREWDKATGKDISIQPKL